MTIEDIKQELNNHIGDKVIIKHNLGRNKVEKYEVIIKELYNYVFTVETNGEEKEVKSFSYIDIITKTIKIDY
jgi:uncharacterized protein Veg